MQKTLLLKLIPVLGLAALHTLVSAQSNYRFSALAALPFAYSATAADINNLGQVVGTTYGVGPFGYTSSATLWSDGTAVDLGVLAGGTSSAAYAINDAGLIVGTSSGNGPTHATLFQAGLAPRDLDPDGGYRDSYATDINKHGHIVGYVEVDRSPVPADKRAILWTETGISSLNPAGYGSAAFGINNNGAIVGDAYTTTTSHGTTAVWYGTATPTSISSEGVFATAINDAGFVVGFARDVSSPDGAKRPVIWQDNRWSELSSQAGAGVASDINLFGQVVGTMNGRAVMWNQGREIYLDTLLDPAASGAGWQLQTAYGINDLGWIVGDAYNPVTKETSAYVLAVTAVPEPGTALLMLMGIAGMAALRRKGRSEC